jgi:hypothetical protein
VSDKIQPIMCVWNAEAGALKPTPAFARVAQRQFEDGHGYLLEVREERSTASHRHFHASINEAWKNLPESKIEEYPSPNHLRKRALIKLGYCDEMTAVLETAQDAERMAFFVKRFDEYAVILVKGNVLKRFTAKSTSARAMDRETFQKMKTEVLDLISSLIGVTRAELETQGSNV